MLVCCEWEVVGPATFAAFYIPWKGAEGDLGRHKYKAKCHHQFKTFPLQKSEVPNLKSGTNQIVEIKNEKINNNNNKRGSPFKSIHGFKFRVIGM